MAVNKRVRCYQCQEYYWTSNIDTAFHTTGLCLICTQMYKDGLLKQKKDLKEELKKENQGNFCCVKCNQICPIENMSTEHSAMCKPCKIEHSKSVKVNQTIKKDIRKYEYKIIYPECIKLEDKFNELGAQGFKYLGKIDSSYIFCRPYRDKTNMHPYRDKTIV